jgi:hypothetical protein
MWYLDSIDKQSHYPTRSGLYSTIPWTADLAYLLQLWRRYSPGIYAWGEFSCRNRSLITSHPENPAPRADPRWAWLSARTTRPAASFSAARITLIAGTPDRYRKAFGWRCTDSPRCFDPKQIGSSLKIKVS